MAKPEIDASKIGKQITMTVQIRGLRRFKLRIFLGLLILRLGAWVADLGGFKVRK